MDVRYAKERALRRKLWTPRIQNRCSFVKRKLEESYRFMLASCSKLKMADRARPSREKLLRFKQFLLDFENFYIDL